MMDDVRTELDLQEIASQPAGIQIYVDGSHDPRVGHGGWGFVVLDGREELGSACGFIDGGDNGTAELTALLKALEWVSVHGRGQATSIWSDSVHVVNGCNSWRHIWRTSQWRRRGSGGKGRIRPVPYAQLWQSIDFHLLLDPDITVAWCKGHGDMDGNIRADALAAQGRLSRT